MYPSREEQTLLMEKVNDGLEVEEIEVLLVEEVEERENVYDFNVPKHHCFFADEMLVSNCSEYISLNDTACNLSSINLVKFLDEDNNIKVEEYKHTIRLWQMILEITNFMAQLPSDAVSRNVWKYRNTGLGPANLGTLLMLMGHAYDSEEGLSIGSSLMSIMTGYSYAVSAEMANELGQFQAYDKNRDHMLRAVKNHRRAAYGLTKNLEPISYKELVKHVGEYDGLEVHPIPLRDKESYTSSINNLIFESRKTWDEALSSGSSYGFRNAQVTVCAPTGCLVSDSMVLSSDGLLPISEMGDCEGTKWQNIERTILQENEASKSDKFYINGVAPTIRIQSERGHILQATCNHQLRVIDLNGDYIWKKMEEIEEGELLATRLGGHESILKDKEYQKLIGVDLSNPSTKVQKTPAELEEKLAELLGLYQGDGYVKNNHGVRIAVCNDDQDLIDYIRSISNDCFGLEEVSEEEKVGCKLITISSRIIARWWRQNEFAKPLGNYGEGSSGAFIPSKVLRSRSSVLCAFLRGLFEADGTIGGETSPIVEFSTVSYDLSRQVFNSLESLNIKSHWSLCETENLDNFGSRIKYRVRVSGVDSVYTYFDKIGFISKRKKELLSSMIQKHKEKKNQSKKNTIHHIGWINELYDLSVGLKNEIRQDILVRKNQGKFNYEWALKIINQNEQLKESKFYKTSSNYPNLSFVRVNSSEYGGDQETYDISVPFKNTYVVNGVVSHNTISFIMGCDSTGIEPSYALVSYKTLAGGGVMKIINNSVRRSLMNLNYKEDQINKICKFIEENGHVKGAGIRQEHESIFKCAASPLGDDGIVNWRGHIKMLAALQAFVSGGISKTINMPESSTKEDISEAFKMGYKLGCKGISIYRDNCKGSAPLQTKKDDPASSCDMVKRITDNVLIGELGRRKTENSLDINSVLEKLGVTNQDIIETKKNWGQRRRPGNIIPGMRFRIKIGQSQGYVQMFLFPDGKICEFFLTFGNPGSSLNNMLECWSIAFSIALQRGESLYNLCTKFIGVEFEPKGFTGRTDDIRKVTSPVDYIARLMLENFDDEGYVKDKSMFKEMIERSPINFNVQKKEHIKKEELQEVISEDISSSNTRPVCPNCGSTMTSGTEKCPSCPVCGYFGGCG